MISRRTASRLTQPRLATALCLAVLIAVGGATGLLWSQLSESSGAQLDLDRGLVALDRAMLRVAGTAPDSDDGRTARAEATFELTHVYTRAGSQQLQPALNRFRDAAVATIGARQPDLSAYLSQRADVQSRLVAGLTDTDGRRLTVLTAAAGIAAVLVGALATVGLADMRRRRRAARPSLLVTAGAEGAYDLPTLTRELEVAAARALATGSSLACVVVEVDHYDAYVQTQGGAAGELLLEEIADIVRDAVRATDSAYRSGETSFVLTLPDTGCAAATRLAERLRESIVRSLLGEGVTVSGGVAAVPSSALGAADLLAAAHAALKDAQRQGRNQVRRATVPSDEVTETTENVGRH
ncbi:MAG: hypothetical protein JWM93_953 [Frankiales bacterium]|nr:hypothetical protein [Frankiales bacterium]